jgi:hypothetical protein
MAAAWENIVDLPLSFDLSPKCDKKYLFFHQEYKRKGIEGKGTDENRLLQHGNRSQ